MIGVPCSGKSTYRNQMFGKKTFIISRDDLRDKIVSEMRQAEFDVSYEDFFAKPEEGEEFSSRLYEVVNGEWSLVAEMNKRLKIRFQDQIELAKELAKFGYEIVIDLLNHTLAERKVFIQTFQELDSSVEFNAVVFDFEQNREKIKVLNERRAQQGKAIPYFVIEKFMRDLEVPSFPSEPFSKITHVDGLQGVNL
nr:AAA family ATPase [Vibrio sp. D431a]